MRGKKKTTIVKKCYYESGCKRKYAKMKKTDTQKQHMIDDRCRDTVRRETNLQTQKK
jgi:hypothetical protein